MNTSYGGIWKQWPHYLDRDDRIILRIDGRLYENGCSASWRVRRSFRCCLNLLANTSVAPTVTLPPTNQYAAATRGCTKWWIASRLPHRMNKGPQNTENLTTEDKNNETPNVWPGACVALSVNACNDALTPARFATRIKLRGISPATADRSAARRHDRDSTRRHEMTRSLSLSVRELPFVEPAWTAQFCHSAASCRAQKACW